MNRWQRVLHGLASAAIVVSSTIAVTSVTSGSVYAVDGSTRFVAVAATQLMDTASPGAGFSRIDPTTVHVPVVGASDVPADAVAVVLSLDVAEATASGHALVYRSGAVKPTVSMANFAPTVPAVTTVVVRLGDDGAVDLYHSAPARVRLSVVGYFEAAVTAAEGRFVGLAQRLLDTRRNTALLAGVSRLVTVPVPVGTEHVVLNVTTVSSSAPGSLAVGAADFVTPRLTAVRVGGSMQTRAGLVVVPVHDGVVDLRSTMVTHAIVDLVGYFTGPGSLEGTDGLFVPVEPQRLRDTRMTPPRLWTNGTQEIAYGAAGTAAVWVNLTAVSSYSSGYLTVWAAGTAQPPVSNLNTTARATVANSVIAGLSDRGFAVRSTTETQFLLDCFGWFSGTRATATRSPLLNEKYPYVPSVGPGQVALTFDDGPHPITTPMVVAILEAARVGGTFFVIGGLAELYPSVAAAAFRLGHSIQSHTYSHRRLRSLTRAGVIEELNHANRIITGITGRRPAAYRPPYGSTDQWVRDAAATVNMREIMWNASTGMMDPADTMVASIRSQAQAAKLRGQGLTVLFHDGSGCRGCTVVALPRIIEYLKSQGWQFVVIG